MWQFFRGYVILQIEGMAIARFLRRISQAGIRITGLRQTDAGCIRLCIDKRHFFDLHRLRLGLPLRVHIVERRGLPFLLRRLRKRPVLCIGTLLVLIGLFAASQRVWMIRIEGNETIDDETILAMLKDHGLSVGSRPKGPILITAANDLSADIHDAAWVGLDREGITLKVSVVEATDQSENRAGEIPSDLVADRDGVITEITVLRGIARVKVGDRVKQGDVLISGIMPWNDAEYHTWADGIVRCAVQYEAETPVAPTVTEAIQTDETRTVRTFRIGPWTLARTSPGFEQYRLTEEETVSVSDRLPIYCDRFTACEIVLRERTLSEEEAEQLALIGAREEALEQVPKTATVLNQYGTILVRDGSAYAHVIVTAEETIGRTEEYPNDG